MEIKHEIFLGHETKPEKYFIKKEYGEFTLGYGRSKVLYKKTKYKSINTDKKENPYILSKLDNYFVNDNGITIEKNWPDLEEINKILDTTSLIKLFIRDELNVIFQALFDLDKSIQTERRNPNNNGQTYDKEVAIRILKAVKRAINKYNKSTKNKISAIVAMDSLFAIGDDFGPVNIENQKRFIKQISENNRSILVVGKSTYNTDWWKSIEEDLSNVEVRILTDENLNLRKSNHRLFFDHRHAVSKQDYDFREIVIIGGEKTYKKLFDRINHIYAFIFEEYFPELTSFFSELELHNWDTLEVQKLKEEIGEVSFVHLKAVKGRTIRWKESKLKHERILKKASQEANTRKAV